MQVVVVQHLILEQVVLFKVQVELVAVVLVNQVHPVQQEQQTLVVAVEVDQLMLVLLDIMVELVDQV
tara:strand:+ start:531 stop:731 length:201 start_codon:yes stop_codon:yes gene_type:complete